jgi:hypothetical protein
MISRQSLTGAIKSMGASHTICRVARLFCTLNFFRRGVLCGGTSDLVLKATVRLRVVLDNKQQFVLMKLVNPYGNGPPIDTRPVGGGLNSS